MTLRGWRYGLAATVVMLGLLSTVSGANYLMIQGQPPCTVTVKPGESIQKAIDAPSSGAVICLAAGTWEENLTISKSLTLQGTGWEQTVIDGVQKDYPVVWIKEATPTIAVKIEGLAIGGAEGWCADWPICAHGVLIQGSAQATITNAIIARNSEHGIVLEDSAQATITNSTISRNTLDYGVLLADSAQVAILESTISENGQGIVLGGSAQATISSCTISRNGAGIELRDTAKVTISNSTISGHSYYGIVLKDSVQATISNSTISRNYGGIDLSKSAQATVSDSQISGNRQNGITMYDLVVIIGVSTQAIISSSQVSGNGWYGIYIGSSAQAIISNSRFLDNGWNGIGMRGKATISGSQVSGNGLDGIAMGRLAQAEIRGSTIEGNGTNGIGVQEKSQVKIIGSKIIKNADWGVGASLKQCGHQYGDFTGQVAFEDMMLDQIAGNNTSGNQTGMGNPGNHPWNRPDIPDGQVCLP